MTEGRPAHEPLARRWAIVFGLSMGTAVSNGLARFAYGLILPAMREDLGWNYAQAGWINTANAIGYLLGALAAIRLVGLWGAKRLFVGGMGLMALALFASGFTRDFALLTALRGAAGLGGGPAFVSGAALVSVLFRGDGRRTALAIAGYMGGGGIGMIASGLALPLLFASVGVGAWPWAWRALGAAAAIATLVSLPAVRATPDIARANAGRTPAPLPLRAMSFEIAGYFLFGVGYIVYLTFLVAWMRKAGASPVLVAATWSVIGVGIVLSPIPWAPVLQRSRGGGALALSNLATGLATILPPLAPGTVGLLVSGAAFGLSIFMSPAAVTAFGRANLAQAQWGRSVALFTSAFALGQILGPIAAGALADVAHDLAIGLLAGGGVLVLGALVAAVQKPLSRAELSLR